MPWLRPGPGLLTTRLRRIPDKMPVILNCIQFKFASLPCLIPHKCQLLSDNDNRFSSEFDIPYTGYRDSKVVLVIDKT